METSISSFISSSWEDLVTKAESAVPCHNVLHPGSVSHFTRTSLISSLKREGTFTSISFSPKKNLLKKKKYIYIYIYTLISKSTLLLNPAINIQFQIQHQLKMTNSKVSPILLLVFVEPGAVLGVNGRTGHAQIFQASAEQWRFRDSPSRIYTNHQIQTINGHVSLLQYFKVLNRVVPKVFSAVEGKITSL